jgi:hypothetical protein
MPKGVCDCGAKAEKQFVLSTGKGEAKRLAAEAKRARAAGGSAPDVCCGDCIAKRIAERGLFVTEELKHKPIKFERVTFNTKCLDCGKDLPFGYYAHFHADSGCAICVDCGVKRGWSDKAIAQNSAKLQELKADLAALRKRVKVESQGLFLIEEKVGLHQIGEGYNELEKQIEGALAKLQSYLFAVATPQEKALLQELEGEIRRLQDLAREIKLEFDARLFWLDKNQQKVKNAQAAMSDEELEVLQQGSGSEVASR